MDYKKKLKRSLYLKIAYTVLGFTLILLYFFTGTENNFLFAYGFAMLFLGIGGILRLRKITANEKNIRRQELLETDERNRMIAERARSWSFSFSVMIAGIVVIVLSLLGNHDLAQPFAWFVCLMSLLYWICWHIIQKKY